MRIIIGLGNPGDKYTKTRHNIGFYCLDLLEKMLPEDITWQNKYNGLIAEVFIDGEKALLFKPMQFMNLSGIPVKQLMDYLELKEEDILIIADDVYLAPGLGRLRVGGGDGGHNGWKSIIAHLNENKFLRLRVGAGIFAQDLESRNVNPALEDYVLQNMPVTDRKQVEKLIDKVGPNLINWLSNKEELDPLTWKI